MSDKVTKKFRTTSTEIFTKAVDLLATTPGELCILLGYSRGAYTGWTEEMPYVAGLACEHLMEKVKSKGTIFVVKCETSSQSVALESFLSLTSIKFTKI